LRVGTTRDAEHQWQGHSRVETPRHIQSLIRELTQCTVRHECCKIHRFRYTEYNLFVNNVAREIDDAGLFLVFGERYRSCRGAKVYRNSDGTSKGLGFVRFADQTDQQRALVEMNKARVHGKELILKLAQPKYRAPKAARGAQTTQYDPSSYYPQVQAYYNAAAAVSYQSTGVDASQLAMLAGQGGVQPAHLVQIPIAGVSIIIVLG
jgi:hypothetical protein